MVRPRSFSLVVLCLFVTLRTFAATHVWTGAIDDHFSNASNWIGGSPASDAAASISFPSSSRSSATNDLSGLTVQSIAFSAGGFTIAGNAITLAPNATIIDTSKEANTIACNLVLAGDVEVSAANSLTLSGAIGGTGGLSLTNGGSLVFSGSQPNTYSGSTRVVYGQLLLKKPANVIDIAAVRGIDS